eukprot:1158884-Pelagomonas_calceolata.AAC.4
MQKEEESAGCAKAGGHGRLNEFSGGHLLSSVLQLSRKKRQSASLTNARRSAVGLHALEISWTWKEPTNKEKT